MKPGFPMTIRSPSHAWPRLVLAAAVLAVLLAVACECAAATELARGGPFGATFEPVGFDGANVIVHQDQRVLAIGPAGRRVLVRDAGLEDAVAGAGTLAFVRRHADRVELLAGPVGGPWPVQMSCSARERPAPAPTLAGAVVLWPACDGLSVLALTPDGHVVYDAGGRVRALAGDGDRVAWVAEDDNGELRVLTRAFADPASVLFGYLGVGAQEALVSVAVAGDGRVRASRTDVDVETTCTTVGDGIGTRRDVRRGLCPRHVTFTDEGSVESRSSGRAHTDGAIVRRSRSGAVVSTIASYAQNSGARPFTTDGVRIAASLLTCRGSRLVDGPLATAQFAKPSCPILPTARNVTATRAGVVRVRVRCAHGCLGVPDGIDLRLGNLGRVFTSETGIDLTAGRSGHIAFRLSRGQLRGLHGRGTVTGLVSIIGYEERTRFSVRVRAPR
jgi:hypothetical protein